ncbi:putative NADH-ubiquinone oxidoreductase 9.5 kDa subunit [Saitoella complicata NRRL Y-17804]|uniref:putative NADH-ubiquinone oxidoreductase 9.5 kDa subunit n=1 Tax=Saitoella complicata (strain BCRC 22490 / CBS 7301 / JCM 7358 / NBRC 10748 / NRRL Y-17804) TaxID=698492 RepID=UPI000866F805|nr:putative NADH-ubiquinone oxidoreductase 9.5 kDa subunit [Saitoella complicata NRRL Y-17804]ODQ52810.1 putative NADH-ubiquinone oxidoreductase 9.5 kDa subunit [Saitoella complicata NRRL Y-17804]
MAPSRFWANPVKYCHWAAVEHPAVFYSMLMGLAGPVIAYTVPPIRRKLGYPDHIPLPMGYPLPKRARDTTLTGYDD